jgi:dihydrofolate reductase
MGKIVVFNHFTLDGYFVDGSGDMSWAHRSKDDPEWKTFVGENASGEGTLVFGRKTYDLMASYWPTPMAMQNDRVVAEGMNKLPKVVFSRTMDKAAWSNTTLIKGDLIAEAKKLKEDSGKSFVILGSGSIVSQLAEENLIDEYQLALNPITLGKGRTMFDGIKQRLALKLTKSRAFGNGTVMLWYQPVV